MYGFLDPSSISDTEFSLFHNVCHIQHMEEYTVTLITMTRIIPGELVQ